MCEGVLLWLLVTEPNFQVPSHYSWQIVAQCPFQLGRIERKVTAPADPSRKVCPRQSQKLAAQQKKALAKSRRKVLAVSDTDSDANVSTLALNPPSDDESTSTASVPMEVHRRNWHCLNLFRPPYVCGQCHKTVYLWCMHCEGCGFCLYTLECPVRGGAHPNTDKWLFQKWCQEVDVEEVLTATLPNEPVSGDEEVDALSNLLLASPPPGKALPSAPPVDPPTSKRRTRSTIASETTPLGVGDWLTDKDFVCWLNQEVCHNESDEPRAWTLALLYIKRLSRYM